LGKTIEDDAAALLPLLNTALLGDLTASLLHEINNPITAILNYARLLQMRHFQPEEAEEFAKSIVAEGERIAELANRLTPLARPTSFANAGARLQEALSLALSLYKTRFRYDGIIVESQPDPNLPATQFSLPGLMQLILPLLELARQALNARIVAPATNKILRCYLSAANGEENNAQRLTLIHNGMLQSGADLTLFRHLFKNAASEMQMRWAATITQALLAQLNCKIAAEQQAEGWTAIHLNLPAQK
jgi:C4-dicarboxylate-specific signal transduction histidine kinase